MRTEKVTPLYKLKRGEEFKTRAGFITMVVSAKKGNITWFYAATDIDKKNRMHLHNLVMVVPSDQVKNWDAIPSEYPHIYKSAGLKAKPSDPNQKTMLL